MGNVLYEIHYEFELSVIVPFLMVIFIMFFPKILEVAHRERKIELSRGAKRATKIVCFSIGGFMLFSAVFSLVMHMHMISKTLGAYKNGQYEIVEGYVENFSPMPYEGHTHESFDIDGVHFEYSDYSIVTGYNNAKSHGGVINGDGQYLKIGYVYYNSTYGNIILYIEENPSTE